MRKILAFIHPSYANEKNLKEDNQRLEFLGDSIISFITSNFLYEKFPEMEEGSLTKIKSYLVSTENLSFLAKKIGIDKKIFLSNGEEKCGGREKATILADAFEAYLAYIYLKKSFKKAKKFLEPLLEETLKEKKDILMSIDSKSKLQQICQKKGFQLPEYKIKELEGPAHSPIFTVEVYINGNFYGKGRGFSKKEAEKNAAEEALKNFKDER